VIRKALGTALAMAAIGVLTQALGNALRRRMGWS
jgi:hypothetical protein